MSLNLSRRHLGAVCILVTAACGSKSPNNPTPSVTAVVQVVANPNPVPFSGAPITDQPACAGSTNTWFFEQTLTETAGAAVSITSASDTIDGVTGASGTANLSIPARGSITTRHSYCFTPPVQHTIQKRYSGTDANGHSLSFAGPLITLMAR